MTIGNEGARPGVSVFREAVGSLGWTESGSRAWRRANPKSRTVKKVPTFPESTSSRLRKVRLSARADAGGPAVARTERIVAEAGHGGKEKSTPPAAPRRAFLRFPETEAARDSKSILARRGGVLRAEFAEPCSGAALKRFENTQRTQSARRPCSGTALKRLISRGVREVREGHAPGRRSSVLKTRRERRDAQSHAPSGAQAIFGGRSAGWDRGGEAASNKTSRTPREN